MIEQTRFRDESEHDLPPRFTVIWLQVAGLVVIALASIAIIGWFTHTQRMVQVLPNFAPMQFNTALGIFFLGLGLVSVVKFPRWVALASALVFLISFLTLLEYILQINTGLDQLFMKPFILVKSSYPGRMAPNTALCLLFTSLALFSQIKTFKFQTLISLTLSAFVLILGLMAIIGYMANIPSAYGWGKLTGMNIMTATSFIFAGTGLLLLSFHSIKRTALTNNKVLPFILFIIGNIFLLMLWQTLIAEEDSRLAEIVQQDSEVIEHSINTNINIYANTFSRMRERNEFQHGISRSGKMFAAKLYIRDLKGFQAISALTRAKTIEWILENEPKGNYSDLILNCMSALSDVKTNIIISAPAQKKLDYFCLITSSNQGYYVGLMNMDILLKTSGMNNEKYKYYQTIMVWNDKSTVINHSDQQVLSSEWMSSIHLNKIDGHLQLQIWPTTDFLRKNKSMAPLIAMLVGLSLLLLLTLSLYSWLTMKKQKKFLELEIKTRRELQTRFKIITENAKDAIIMINHSGRIIFWNQAATHIFGFQESEVLDKLIHETIIPPSYIEAHKKGFEHFQHSGVGSVVGKTVELTAIKNNGEEFPTEISLARAKVNGQWEAIAILRDITQRKEEEAIIHHKANYDHLTDLPNRSLFVDRLQQALSRADRDGTFVSVLSIDLDGFKQVNDHYGHNAGDELLRQVAERLQKNIRQTDTAARLGGDEFWIILVNLKSSDEAFLVAEKLLAYLSTPFFICHEEVSISGSIGISTYPSNEIADQEELIIQADRAMYVSKRMGKNRIHCYATSP